MDSLTQLTFGAACGGAVMGRTGGRKALAWGAVLGTLPDLDVFIPLGSPVDDFVYHRGFSHSLFLLGLLAPLAAWLITRIHPGTKDHFRRWTVMAFVTFETAVLLDLLTIYGTRVLWPFDVTPQAIPVLFIIDPLLTLPVLIGVLAALFLRQRQELGWRLNRLGLGLACAYLGWALIAGAFVNRQVANKLAQQDVGYSQMVACPAPFNTLLWRIVGIDGDRYFETYYSLFDGDAPLHVDHHPRNLNFAIGLDDHPPVEKLADFSRGYFAYRANGDDVVLMDLRMGAEPHYVFQFKVGQFSEWQATPTPPVQVQPTRDWRSLKWIWQRIWNPIPKE